MVTNENKNQKVYLEFLKENLLSWTALPQAFFFFLFLDLVYP